MRLLQDGAILVFLPGWDDIGYVKHLLEDPAAGFPAEQYAVLPLHSGINPSEQNKVFVSYGSRRKIVLSTNVAETSLTIDDVVYVINSGYMKEKSYDPFTGVSALKVSLVSSASERQRRGRAGRCQPGVCFHLYSSAVAAELPVCSPLLLRIRRFCSTTEANLAPARSTSEQLCHVVTSKLLFSPGAH